MKKMNGFELSFCIPTYNSAQNVHKLVTSILLCNDPAIEVVVLDNGSIDNTLEKLRSIDDERLAIYANGENKGFLFNVVNVLNKGRGSYLVYSNDQDHVDHNKIEEFKSFLLRQPSLAGGFCMIDSEAKIDFELFLKGYPAISQLAYKGRHPTGYFMNNAFLKSINFVERFSDFDVVDLFPIDFAFAELCSMGNGAIYHLPIFTLETPEMVVKRKSDTTNGKSKKAFFSPDARLKLATSYTNHINTLTLVEREKCLLILDSFIHELIAATLGYKSMRGNKYLCIHYGMECRVIKTQELVDIGMTFYRQYRKSAIEFWGGGYITQFNFEYRLCLRLLKKIIWRAMRIVDNRSMEKRRTQ